MLFLLANSTPISVIDQIKFALEEFDPFFQTIGGHAVLAGILVAAGYLAGLILSLAFKWTDKRFGKADGSSSLLDLVAAFIRLLLMVFAILAALNVLGISILGTFNEFLTKALTAGFILLAAGVAARWLAKNIHSLGETLHRRSSKTDVTLFSFIASLVKYSIVAVAIVFALSQFVQSGTSMVAILGAAGLAIALALQDTLKGVAAGVLLAFFRPYKLGDWIILSDDEGEVVDITPFKTTLVTADNKTVVIPNDQAWGDVIVNATTQPNRRLDLIFSIAYEDSIDKGIDVITQVLVSDPRVADLPPVWVGVSNLGDWSVDIRARAWCATQEYFQLKADMLRAVKLAFDENGLTIPYPHQVEIRQSVSSDRH